MNSVLKYPGSKWRIADWIISYMPPHHSYLEPYFGSGAVFFNKVPSAIETINDIDGNVINLFQCIRENADCLAGLVAATPYSRAEYNAVFNVGQCENRFEEARQFLVRCWMAAGVRTGMKTGWRNDVQGREAAYALRNWYRLPVWIEECSERLRHAQIECMPAIDLIKRFNSPKVLIYADPPYVTSTRMPKQYAYEMTDAQHEDLLISLCEHKGPVIISGYDNELYDYILKGWNKTSIRSTAERGSRRIETLWINFETAIQTSLFENNDDIIKTQDTMRVY